METQWLDVLKQTIESGFWPLSAILIAWIFRRNIGDLVTHLARRVKNISGPGYNAEFGDTPITSKDIFTDSNEDSEAAVSPPMDNHGDPQQRTERVRMLVYSSVLYNTTYTHSKASDYYGVTDEIQELLDEFDGQTKETLALIHQATDIATLERIFSGHAAQMKAFRMAADATLNK